MNRRSLRDRLALISGINLEQLDGLELEERRDEFEPNLARLIIGLEQLDDMEDDDEPIGGFGLLQEDFVAQVGLNETPLTKALSSGNFNLAEKLILDNTDTDYLNDGLHGHTPLNICLSGKSSLVQKPRNLKLARILMENGANLNLRMPEHEMGLEINLTVPESPIELLLQYYLDLLKTFKNMLDGNKGINIKCDEVDEDLLETIGIHGELKPTSDVIIEHTRELLFSFFDRGGDVNLQTNQSGRTIFHMALCGEVTDYELIEKMVNMGALINLTDVHGSTPFMDVLCHRNANCGILLYQKISSLGKRILLDAQNCSGQSALWRSLFNGHLEWSQLLLREGASAHTSPRIQEIKPKRPNGRFRFYLRRNSVSTLPAILAPLLEDSQALKKVRDRGSSTFSIDLLNEVVLSQISPLVDEGWFCSQEVERSIHDLLRSFTEFKHLTGTNVFQEVAIIPLIFGEKSAGLRQKCLRKILYSVLFSNDPEIVIKSLLDSKDSFKNPVSETVPSSGKIRASLDSDDGPGDSACVISSVLSDTTATTDPTHDVSLSGRTLSEPEMRRSTSTPQPLRARRVVRRRRNQTRERVLTFESDIPRQIDDNWVLRQNPDYSDERRNHARTPQPLENVEIEISREENDDGQATGGSPTVVRIHRLLKQTNDMLERLQSDFDNSLKMEMSTRHVAVRQPDSDSDTENFWLETGGAKWRSFGSKIVTNGKDESSENDSPQTESGSNPTGQRPAVESSLNELLKRRRLSVEGTSASRTARQMSEPVRSVSDEMPIDDPVSITENVERDKVNPVPEEEDISSIGSETEFWRREIIEAQAYYSTSSSTSKHGDSPEVSSSDSLSEDSSDQSFEASNFPGAVQLSKKSVGTDVPNFDSDVSHRQLPLDQPSGLASLPFDEASNVPSLQNRPDLPSAPDSFLPWMQLLIGAQNVREQVQTNRPDSPMPSLVSSESSLHSSNDSESFFQPSPTDESWGGGPFSLRHTMLADARLRRHSNGLRSSSPWTIEAIILKLCPLMASNIAKQVGIPPGLISCFELEMARLQLFMSVFHHRSIDCDRGCEGEDDSNSSDSDADESSDENESSEDLESSSGPYTSATGADLSSSLGSVYSDEDSELDVEFGHSENQIPRILNSSSTSLSSVASNENDVPYDPAVPRIPRRLSSSSSDSNNPHESDAEVDSLDFRLGHLEEKTEEDQNDWFSVVGDMEHASTSRYVQGQVDSLFHHSTDSGTDQSDVD